MSATHKDLEFAVDDASGKERIFKVFAEACAFAVSLAASGRVVNLDVLCWSESAAQAWGGDYAAELYREDPEASVSERIVIQAESIGSVA